MFLLMLNISYFICVAFIWTYSGACDMISIRKSYIFIFFLQFVAMFAVQKQVCFLFYDLICCANMLTWNFSRWCDCLKASLKYKRKILKLNVYNSCTQCMNSWNTRFSPIALHSKCKQILDILLMPRPAFERNSWAIWKESSVLESTKRFYSNIFRTSWLQLW